MWAGQGFPGIISRVLGKEAHARALAARTSHLRKLLWLTPL